jgi:acylphosphatase
MIKRYRVLAQGRVQGVGFRGTCMMYAMQYNLTGSVKNLPDGDVEIYVQGEETSISRFLSDLRAGDRWIRIDHLLVEERPVEPDEKKFRCSYY